MPDSRASGSSVSKLEEALSCYCNHYTVSVIATIFFREFPDSSLLLFVHLLNFIRISLGLKFLKCYVDISIEHGDFLMK